MLPPSPPLTSPEDISGDRQSLSYSPSILIIAGLLAFAVVAIASIQLLLRYLSRSRQSPSPSSSSSSPPPFLHHLPSSSSSSLSTSNNQDPMRKDVDVIDSLPLFSFSAAGAATKPSSSSSVDCVVCLSPFEPRDRLRLLPSCRHAFHSHCIDTWLRSTLSCPLCRSPVHPPPTPPPPPPPAPAGESSLRVEIGTASRRTADGNPLGSSFEYFVEEEEEEEVLSRIRRPEKSAAAAEPPPAASPTGEAVIAGGGGGGGSMNWLRDYVDRFVSSASSSFSSIRWSCRLDSVGSGGGGGGGVVAHGGEHYWDLERNLHLHLEEEDGGFSSFYRWLLGA